MLLCYAHICMGMDTAMLRTESDAAEYQPTNRLVRKKCENTTTTMTMQSSVVWRGPMLRQRRQRVQYVVTAFLQKGIISMRQGKF